MLTGAVAAAAGALLAGYTVGGTRGMAEAGAAQAAEVYNLEVYGGSGTVYHFPGDDKSSEGTTVVWVTQNDEPDDDAAPEPSTGGPI
jgi:hypothetical protein